MTPAASIAICPTYNSKGKKDVTGAFLPEAKRFAAFRAAEGEVTSLLRQFDNSKSKRQCRAEVEELLDLAPYPLSCVAFFCHGFRRGLQTGHNTWNVARLASAIVRNSVPDVRVVLYACDTARDGDNQRSDDTRPGPGGEGGFADKLRDALWNSGAREGWVDAHPVTAHATKAPYVRRFYTSAEAALADMGGDWLVAPGSPLWKAWRDRLQNDAHFRLTFPLMSAEAIRGAL